MTDGLRESVSALVDGEADELERRRLLAGGDYPQVREIWADFQRVRGSLNGVDAAIAQLDISARVQAALADEPAARAAGGRRWWRPAASVAVAASMAAVVVFGARNFATTEPGAAAPALADATAVGGSPEPVAVSPTAGKVFPALPSPLRGSSTVSATYDGVPGNIVVPAQMYSSAQARAEAEAKLRRQLQAYLLMQVEREAAQQQAAQNP